MTIPHNKNRDVVDSIVAVEVLREVRREVSREASSPPAEPQVFYSEEEPMQEDNFEFSDAEVAQDQEPVRTRTRSQSRAKENSVPPAEPLQKQKRVRRGTKKVVDTENEKPRRRRIIKVEPLELNTDDDEWATRIPFNFLLSKIYFL